MEEKKKVIEKGLYKNLDISVKVLDTVIVCGLLALVAVMVFAYFSV